MRTQVNRSPVLARRVVVLVTFFTVTLIGVGSCAAKSPDAVAGQSVSQPQETQDPWARFYRYRAFVVWSCSQPAPIGFVRVNLRQSVDEQIAALKGVLKHEKNHDDFMRSFESCGAFHSWASDAENRLTLEALGACAQLRQEVADGDHPVAAWSRAVTSLTHSYGFPVSRARAERRLEAVCP